MNNILRGCFGPKKTFFQPAIKIKQRLFISSSCPRFDTFSLNAGFRQTLKQKEQRGLVQQILKRNFGSFPGLFSKVRLHHRQPNYSKLLFLFFKQFPYFFYKNLEIIFLNLSFSSFRNILYNSHSSSSLAVWVFKLPPRWSLQCRLP